MSGADRLAGGESLARHSLRGAAWALGAQGVTALASLLAFALLGRQVGHAELGEYVMALVGLAAVQWLSLNAWREPLVQLPAIDDGLRDSVFWVTLLLALGQVGLVLGAAAVLPRLGGGVLTAACLQWMSGKLFFDTLSAVPMACCARALRFPLLARISIVGSLAGSLLAILLLHLGWGVLALACAQSLTAALGFVMVLMRCGWRPRLRLQWSELTRLRGYTPHVLAWQAVEAFNMYFDRFLVGMRLSAHALGVYGFARRLNDVVIEVLVGAAGNVALPAYATLQDRPDALRGAYLRSLRVVSFAVFPVIGILYGVADELVPAVFGAKWAVAVPIYRCFLLLGAIQTIGILQAALIRSLGHAGLWSRYQAVQAVANVVTVLVAIDYGVLALALTVVLRSYLIWLWAVRMTCRLIAMPVRDYLALLLRPALGALGAGLAAQLAGHLLHERAALPWMAPIAGAVLAGGVAYLALALATMRSMSGDLRALLRR